MPNLHLIETIDSQKLAKKLNSELEKAYPTPDGTAAETQHRLSVLVQVLTGGETSKFGVEPASVRELVTYIRQECPRLNFRGLMSMGLLHDVEGFRKMFQLRKELADEILPEEHFILSMGISADIEMAIAEGATEVRLGTTIFGARDYSKKD